MVTNSTKNRRFSSTLSPFIHASFTEISAAVVKIFYVSATDFKILVSIRVLSAAIAAASVIPAKSRYDNLSHNQHNDK